MKKVIIDKDGIMRNARTKKAYTCPVAIHEYKFDSCGQTCAWFDIRTESCPPPNTHISGLVITCHGVSIAVTDEVKQAENEAEKDLR